MNRISFFVTVIIISSFTIFGSTANAGILDDAIHMAEGKTFVKRNMEEPYQVSLMGLQGEPVEVFDLNKVSPNTPISDNEKYKDIKNTNLPQLIVGDNSHVFFYRSSIFRAHDLNSKGNFENEDKFYTIDIIPSDKNSIEKYMRGEEVEGQTVAIHMEDGRREIDPDIPRSPDDPGDVILSGSGTKHKTIAEPPCPGGCIPEPSTNTKKQIEELKKLIGDPEVTSQIGPIDWTAWVNTCRTTKDKSGKVAHTCEPKLQEFSRCANLYMSKDGKIQPWGQASLNAIHNMHAEDCFNKEVDYTPLCPNYKDFNDTKKKAFQIMVLGAMGAAEASCNPNAKNTKSPKNPFSPPNDSACGMNQLECDGKWRANSDRDPKWCPHSQVSYQQVMSMDFQQQCTVSSFSREHCNLSQRCKEDPSTCGNFQKKITGWGQWEVLLEQQKDGSKPIPPQKLKLLVQLTQKFRGCQKK